MNQAERRTYLIQTLLNEAPEYAGLPMPANEAEAKNLLRALLNLRPPKPVSKEFLAVQDAYLQAETAQKGITNFASLTPLQKGLYLWQGDITTLQCGAIVNAANSQMLGCFCPCHTCIDNAIHTFAGVQLRLACAQQMRQQGHSEPTGQAKITPAFNLPCQLILHTVGPIVHGKLRQHHETLLAACYQSCLVLAEQWGVKSLAFCCISTGEFHFPNDRAATIALQTVKDYQAQTHSNLEVIFNVFQEQDFNIYQRLLGGAKPTETLA